jgi:Tol biopolymer transport system component
MLARSRDLVAGGAFLLALSVAMPAAAQGPERAATLPFVAPDGKHIVYVRDLPDKSAELVVIDAAGGNGHVVARDPRGTVMGDWTSGGREVTYVMTANDTTTLYRVGVDGGTPVPMARLVCRGLRLSNDGKRVAYSVGEWTRSRLTVAKLDGRGAKAITDSSASYFNIAWSRDDKRIAVTRLDPSRDLSVWVMDVDGAHARAVTSFADSAGRAQWPTWSPDGRRLAVQVGRYDRNDHSHDRSDIWVIDLASGRATNLTPGDDPWLDETPSWSPDGRSIVFQSTRSGRFEVWRMNADGGAPVQLTH